MALINQTQLLKQYSMNADSVNFSYSGPIDQYILRSISDFMHKITSETSDTYKKLYIILVELLQNISHYSAEKKQYLENKLSGIGNVFIINAQNEIILIAGNLIKNDQIIPIKQKCELINSLSREELRLYKRQQMNRPYGANDGAHIGLVQVAIISNKPLKFEIEKIDNKMAYFSIEVQLQKKGQAVLI